jgi:superfamily I DNA/RNA helicase
VQGSKGLASDVVFVTDMDDRFFLPKEGLDDKCVCNFIVALTRARRKLFLVSSPGATPKLVGWIGEEKVKVEKLGRKHADA